MSASNSKMTLHVRAQARYGKVLTRCGMVLSALLYPRTPRPAHGWTRDAGMSNCATCLNIAAPRPQGRL